MNRAPFITIEGIEGVGKSTAVAFLQRYLQSKQIPCVTTREPGGTVIAEDIRHVLLHHHPEPMDADTELLLMFACRAQHLAITIKPALSDHYWVLCDRFTDASYAYQGAGRGIAFERIETLEQWVQGAFKPDLTLLLTAPVEQALQRAWGRKQHFDRIEQEQISFFERVQAAYLQRVNQDPQRFQVIDANTTLAEVEKQLHETIQARFHDAFK